MHYTKVSSYILSYIDDKCRFYQRKKKRIPMIKAHNPLEHINETDSNEVTTTIPLETGWPHNCYQLHPHNWDNEYIAFWWHFKQQVFLLILHMEVYVVIGKQSNPTMSCQQTDATHTVMFYVTWQPPSTKYWTADHTHSPTMHWSRVTCSVPGSVSFQCLLGRMHLMKGIYQKRLWWVQRWG